MTDHVTPDRAPQTVGDSARPEPRPELDERVEYAPRARQEQFIVPLLKGAIEPAVRQYARRSGRALDVGCGGQPLRALIQSLGMSYFGLDTQQQPGVTTEYLCAIDGMLPEVLVQGAKFDLVLCTEVLEHVADWNSAWRNLAMLLAPGGSLIVTCPFVYPLHEEPFDFWRPTEHAIRHFGAASGMKVVEFRRLGGPREVVGTLLAASKPSPVRAGVVPKVLASVMRPLHKLAFRAVRAGPFASLVVPMGKVYLSNFAVLQHSERL